MRLPRPWRLPALLVGGVLLATSVSDPLGSLLLALGVVVLLGLVGGVQLLLRRRRARGRAPGAGTWRALLESVLDTEDLFPGGRLSWLAGTLQLDVEVSAAALTLVPRSRVVRRPPLRIAWSDVVDVVQGEPRYERDGKPRVLPLTPVVLVLAGPHLDWAYTPLTDEEAHGEGLTPAQRADEDAEALALAREHYGPAWLPGTRPLTLLVDGDDGLVPLLARYRRGRLPDVAR